MKLEEDIAKLGHSKSFGNFLSHIHNLREDCISDLKDADTHKIQQISGAIMAYDNILKMSDAHNVIARTKDWPV